MWVGWYRSAGIRGGEAEDPGKQRETKREMNVALTREREGSENGKVSVCTVNRRWGISVGFRFGFNTRQSTFSRRRREGRANRIQHMRG